MWPRQGAGAGVLQGEAAGQGSCGDADVAGGGLHGGGDVGGRGDAGSRSGIGWDRFMGSADGTIPGQVRLLIRTRSVSGYHVHCQANRA